MDPKLKDRILCYSPLAAVVKQMYEELGKDRSLEIIKRGLNNLGEEHGRERAKELGGNSLEDITSFYRKRSAESDNVELLEETDKHVAIKITRCLGAEAMRHLGIPEVAQAYCDSDYGMVKAFNPDMKLIRSKTLAVGDDCCDHIWSLQDQE